MYRTAKFVISVAAIGLFWASVCAAGFPQNISESTVPQDKYRIYWYLDHRHQNEAILVRSLEAISRLHEGYVIGVVVMGDGDTLRIGYDRLSVWELPTDLEYDPFAEGVSIYSPGATAPFFESAAMISPEIVLQVLDRKIGTDFGTLEGAYNLFASAIEELVAQCHEVLDVSQDTETSVCRVLESGAAVLFLPPGCSECSLKKFEDSIIGFFDDHKSAYVLVFDDTGPPIALDWIGTNRLLKADRDLGPQFMLLTTLPISARLRPIVCLLEATSGSSPVLEVLK